MMRVILSTDDIAPPSDRWYATDRDLDLGMPIGHGATPLAAIADLLWRDEHRGHRTGRLRHRVEQAES